MTLFRKKKSQNILDAPLFKIGKDIIDISQMVSGALITGATSGGKSSGPALLILYSLFKKNLGGLLICIKPGEVEQIKDVATATHRENDLVIFNKESALSFAFLEYELMRKDNGAGDTNDLVNLLMTIIEIIKNNEANSGGDDTEAFWTKAVRRCISRIITLLRLAGKEVTILNIRKVLADRFTEKEVEAYRELSTVISRQDEVDESTDEKWEQNNDRVQQALRDYEDWTQENFFFHCYDIVNQKNLTEEELESFHLAANYFMRELPALSEKTVAIIQEYIYGMAESFLTGIMRTHFSNGVSAELRLERCFLENKIIVVDFNLKEHGINGAIASGIMKHMFQLTIERRNIKQEAVGHPAFLFVDEYQSVVSSHDAIYQSTCRSARCITTYITQSLNSIIFCMGRHSPTEKAKALLNNLSLKIFCANSDETNVWASSMIGKSFIETKTLSINSDKSISSSISQLLHDKVPPDRFTMLKTGRAVNNYKVEAVVFKPGVRWKTNNGENYMISEFDQKLLEKINNKFLK